MHQLTLLCIFVPLQGKEFETRLKEKKPGDLSDELRIALGMPVGPVSFSKTVLCRVHAPLKNNECPGFC